MPVKVIAEGDAQREICVLSYSSYSVYASCPKRYYREKVLKEPLIKVDESYTIPGRIVHHAAGKFFDEHSFDEFDPEFLRNELAKLGNLPTVDLVKAYGSFEKAYDLLIKSVENLKVFLTGLDPTHQYMSEKWFGVWNAPLFLSNNLAIQGAADLIDISPDGTATVYDFKTSWNTRNLSRDQLILYMIAAKLKWGIDIQKASFFLLPMNKQNFYEVNEFDKDDLLRRFQQAADSILSQKEALPEVKNSKCRFCPFYGNCESTRVEQAIQTIPEGPVSFNFGADL